MCNFVNELNISKNYLVQGWACTQKLQRAQCAPKITN